MSNAIPRRIDMHQWTPAEHAIREAMVAVEKAGAHPLLTDAVVLLGQAKDKVADFVDRSTRREGTAMASEKQPAPKPTYTVEISVGGCEWERVVEELLRAVEHVREHGTACNQVWGGGGTHGHVQIVQREVIEAQYRDELEAWFQALKATTHTTRDGAGEA